MERTTLIQLTGLSESKLNTKLNQVALMPQFSHLDINATNANIPDEVANFIIAETQPKQLNGKIARTRKTKKSSNRTPAKPEQTAEMSLRSMSLDTSALDVMELEELEQLANAIDSARDARNLTQENLHSQQESHVSESLIQADIEGELSGELEGITYLQAHHRGKQKVLNQYAQFQEENHNKTVQAILKKYQEINSQPSEDIARQTAESYTKKLELRKAILSRRV